MTNLDSLRAAFSGTLHTPQDQSYEDARAVFNSTIETRPAVIAQCDHTADVQEALAFAQRAGLPVAVRSGGHSVAGASLVQDGLVLDMRRMNAVSISPDARSAVVGGGATWSAFDQAAQPFGAATTGGRVSTTGVAGLTLGGGSGWIERKCGLSCDNLLAVDLVLADGRTVTASETENTDLFWALHGGGGNFGVATSFTFQLHPLPDFSFALLLWPAEEGEAAVRAYRDFAGTAPEEVGGGAIYLTAPPEEFVPAELVGRLCCGVLVTYMGKAEDLPGLVAPLAALEPRALVVTDIPYAHFQSMLDDPPGFRNYWSAEYLRSLPDEAVRAFCAASELMITPSPSQQGMIPWGGAVARGAADWPMANRDTPWVAHPLGLWENPADDQRARDWAHGLRDVLAPWSTGAVYLNFIGDEGADRVVAGYGRENYDRLAAIKAEYDPGNLFNLWHNIVPRKPAVSA
ncbi:FAD-binding protein [Lentzea aerocolonigenes]|uniref:FAD-binding protein n=1 Tax=Lentzea aerocolonigenes TaxID=68170 RepID=A0A0F0GR21_LENAE|nr:FAD-binding oxidoreductase [Lentzea aerocolonigenes]KJK45031.1 FAD-binding protein [Lentzea aerocolonigenes]